MKRISRLFAAVVIFGAIPVEAQDAAVDRTIPISPRRYEASSRVSTGQVASLGNGFLAFWGTYGPDFSRGSHYRTLLNSDGTVRSKENPNEYLGPRSQLSSPFAVASAGDRTLIAYPCSVESLCNEVVKADGSRSEKNPIGNGSFPAVVSIGEGFLVAKQVSDTRTLHIQMLDGEGRSLGEKSFAAGWVSGIKSNGRLALLTWRTSSEGPEQMAVFNSAGTLVAGPFSAVGSVVATDGEDFLLIGINRSTAIAVAARVTAAGRVVASTTLSVGVAPSTYAAAVWADGRYHVVYQWGDHLFSELFEFELDRDARVLARERKLPSPHSATVPSLAANPQGTLLSWIEVKYRDGLPLRTLVSAPLHEPESNVSSLEPVDATEPALAVAQSGPLFAWVEMVGRDHRREIKVRSLGGSPIPVRRSELDQFMPVLVEGASKVLLLWIESAMSANAGELYASVISPAGVPEGVPKLLTGGVARNSRPAAAFAGDGYIVVATSAASGNLVSMKIDQAGETVTGPANVTSFLRGAQVDPAIAWNGEEALVVWTEKFAGRGPFGQGIFTYSLESGMITRSGISRSRYGAFVAPSDVSPASVRWNGTSFFAVWGGALGGRSGTYGRRFSRRGDLADDTFIGTPLSTPRSSFFEERIRPALISEGDRHFVFSVDRTPQMTPRVTEDVFDKLLLMKTRSMVIYEGEAVEVLAESFNRSPLVLLRILDKEHSRLIALVFESRQRTPRR